MTNHNLPPKAQPTTEITLAYEQPVEMMHVRLNSISGISLAREPVPARKDWEKQARCRPTDRTNNLNIFFPKDPTEGAKAKKKAEAFCGQCAVRTDCIENSLEYPVTKLFGIWGGLNERDRRAIRQDRPQETTLGVAATKRARKRELLEAETEKPLKTFMQQLIPEITWVEPNWRHWRDKEESMNPINFYYDDPVEIAEREELNY